MSGNVALWRLFDVAIVQIERPVLRRYRRSLVVREGQVLAELHRTQMHQAGGSLAIANGRLLGGIRPTYVPNIRFL